MSRMTLKQYKASRQSVKFDGPGRTLVRSKPVVKRNKPCPCGTGLKFKVCCLPSVKAVEKHNEKQNAK